MGSYVFKWEHPECHEVYVTGTFDDWSKSQKLDKVGDHFEKEVHFSKIDENIYYKFVVDDNWTTDHTDPQETDASGNTNNVLTPEHIKKDVAAADLGSSDLPGAFPETPAAENQAFSVNPIAASTGLGNPVSVRPGEPLPPSTKSVGDAVTLDKQSYDNAGSGAAPQLPDVVTPERERAAKGGMFGIDNTSGAGTMIPESGLAMGAGAAGLGAAGLGAAALASSGPHISSVGPNSTTAKLAGDVPLEPRGAPHISSVGPSATTTGLAGQVPLESSAVPDVVEKSQETAHASPEASANPEAVQEKSEVEKELQKKVPEAPATSDNTISGKTAGIAAGIAASATAAAAGTAAYISSTKAGQDVKAQLPTTAQNKIDDLAKSSNGAASTGTPIAPTVPDTVQESITKSHQSPEAAGNAEAVKEKSAMETELLKKTHTESSGTAIAATVPDTVQESITKSHVAPEAASNAEAVGEKSAVESELLTKVHPEESAGVPAPTASAATTETAPKATDSKHTGAAIAGGVGATAATSAALAAIVGKSSSSNTPAATQATSASTPVKSTTTPAATIATPTTSQTTSSATPIKSDSLAAPATSQTTSSATPVKSDTLAAPATSQAQTPATAAKSATDTAAAAGEKAPGRDPARRLIDSRDVSPMTRGPNDPAAPTVTTGVASAKTEAKSISDPASTTTPKKTTPAAIATSSTPGAASSSSAAASPSSAKTGESPATDKKKNRRSGFFGKLKEKFHHHDKEKK